MKTLWVQANPLILVAYAYTWNVNPLIRVAYAYNRNVNPLIRVAYAYTWNVNPLILVAYAYTGNVNPLILVAYAYTGNVNLLILVAYAYTWNVNLDWLGQSQETSINWIEPADFCNIMCLTCWILFCGQYRPVTWGARDWSCVHDILCNFSRMCGLFSTIILQNENEKTEKLTDDIISIIIT